ncbi:tyrosine-protein phosphatase [Acidovorax sp.]|uniref:tyrosine-protein phosphatase n=1 Tax=Acidovorax sp. TaxID=1872122 RepID=UPI0034394C2D
MQDAYRGFVHDNAARFAELFKLLLASDAPLVFHCTAGKDRTGFAAAPKAWAATRLKKCWLFCGACKRSFWTPPCTW